MLHSHDNYELMAKSDYLLRKIQDIFVGSFPYFVDWTVASAFNGAILGDKSSVLQLLCYPNNYSNYGATSLVCRLRDMTITAYARSDSLRKFSQVEFERLVLNSEAMFESAYGDAVNDIKARVARLHFRKRWPAQFSVHEQYDRHMEFISKRLGASFIREPDFDSDWLSPEADGAVRQSLLENTEREAEFILNFPTDIELVTSKLRSIVPNITDDLFGIGQMAQIDLFGEEGTAEKALVHVFARHF